MIFYPYFSGNFHSDGLLVKNNEKGSLLQFKLSRTLYTKGLNIKIWSYK